MRRMKKGYAGFILFLALTMLFALPCSAADGQRGLVNENGIYHYYNENGEMVKSAWQTVNGKRYYFGADGSAAKGWTDKSGKKVKASSSKKAYYFDKTGQALTGTRVINGKFYQFNSKGKLNAAKTKKLQKAAKYKARFASLRKLLGKPQKSKYKKGCFDAKGKDGILTYKNFIVYTFRYSSGKEINLGAEAR